MSPATRHPAGGENDVRPEGLAEGIARLRRALRRGARVAEPGSTLALAQLELLAALCEHPGSRPGQLARLPPHRAGVTVARQPIWASGLTTFSPSRVT